MTDPLTEIDRPEPRWPAMIAAASAVALHFALPDDMRYGPPWIVAGLIGAMVMLAAVTRNRGLHHLNNVLGYSIIGILTLGMCYGVGSLVLGVVNHTAKAGELLRSASILWLTNVIVFASLYWRLDAGGPNARERRDAHTEGAFLFPQMTYESPTVEDLTIAEEKGWRPHFIDYLFVAFNTSTAFSPTDAPVLSKWAKLAMMVQAIISFTTVVLIGARAVNIL
ncbi:MAG: hypothetical protein JWM95_5168 [Gemmatimonadetes bacterium]|nr:hypothetical protein [Gemmatimonadota bacterium]